jgi:molybdopterin biosynthesis enzyme
VDGAAAGPIDWNCNGNPTEAGVVSDVTADDRLERLTGHADWPNLVFRFQCTANGFANAPRAEAAPSPEQARGRGVLFPPLAVRMELLPGVPASAKVIFAGSSREIAVAVFGDDRFNATQTDRASLRFAGGAPTRVEIVDVDRDGRSDLLLFFRPDALRLDPAMRRLTLSGSLTSSQRFSAEAEVLILQ